MTSQFRDTQFGHLMRFLSGDKLFRYPDEVDPLRWKSAVERDTTSASTWLRKQNTGSEKSENLNDAANTSARDFKTQDVDSVEPSINHVVEDGKDAYLVDWYGPDDPEVPNAIESPPETFLTREFRILRIGPAAGSYWSAFRSASLAFQSTLLVPFTCLESKVLWKILGSTRP